jgi:pimeloyl-ACP methyl ester carboxylesterase
MTQFFDGPNGRIAYHHSAGAKPTVVFLCGFKSDMEGSKATHLEAQAQAAGRGFLRFDYTGHGVSDGAFVDGTIGQWAEDAKAVIQNVTTGPLILVGSSMGGWISLLLTRALGDRVHGLVTIAAAPDFTEDGFWAEFSDEMRNTVMTDGQISIPSDYGEPYIITRKLIEQGRESFVMRSPLELPMPVRFLQGTADTSVSTQTALNLLEHAQGPDMRLTLVDGKDHSFSDDTCLGIIDATISEVIGG